MLRDPDRPDLNWEDYEIEVQSNPDRPFYAPGNHEGERDAYARSRCAQIERDFAKFNDVTGGYYYTCVERKQRKQS
jgi:hypothetical protein